MSSAPYNVDRLLLLLLVYRTGSLSGAADELALSTSAVSQQMSKLEREVGLPLVVRHPKGMRLTDAGIKLCAHAMTIDNALAAAKNDMAAFAQLDRGEVRIATFPTFAASIMPKVLLHFHDLHPDIEVTVKSYRLDRIAEALERREVDLATLWDYPWAPISADIPVQTTLVQEPTMLLLPATHRLARRRIVELEEVASDPWITRSSHPVASVLSRICRDAGFDPRVVFEAYDYPELLGMVAAGLGVAIAPRLAVRSHGPDVKVVALRGNPAPRRILLAKLAERVQSPATLALVRSFRAVSGSKEWRS
ncbi:MULTISPECIES: LysR family transcriptional regulator [unclassified Brevibacterium]|uniref:LysR family transcriptional regulator n=1 Tax=unclassified Brevibacterium TaxID=2614124 RepID=UPI001BA82AED|nr:LysR family transcriptional regulator [Brevibacterium sp. W7.2]